MNDIKSMTLLEIAAAFEKMGLPKFRATQVYSFLAKGANSFEEMTNLPLALRQSLAEEYTVSHAEIERKLCSQIDDTVKYLFRLQDGHFVEGVVMHYHHGYTLCLSTQVGCRMGCSFCATGMGGLVRNLAAGEMLSQITTAQKDLNIRIANIVLMGMGEPLDNFDETMRFLELVTAENHLNIGARHITLSTCGVVSQMERLRQKNLPITLAVSLHAPNDAIRNTLMPINKKWNVETLLSACKAYAETTGRRVSFEYILIHGVNDTPACAKELATRLQTIPSHLNLIPANPVPGKTHRSTGKQQALAFQKMLTDLGINATVRRTLGADIDASCGQLRNTRGDKN